MKKLILLASCALLASCLGKKPDAEETTAAAAPAAEATAAAAPAATPAAGPAAGSYDITYPDGTKGVDSLMADGTYVSRDSADKVTDKGTWANKDGKTCFTAEGKAEECFALSTPAADGSFAATGPDGKVTQVKPHAKM